MAGSASRTLILGFAGIFSDFTFGILLRILSLAPNQIHIFFLFQVLAQLPLMAAFSFSSSPDLQSFIISVIQRSPSTCCNICLEVSRMSC